MEPFIVIAVRYFQNALGQFPHGTRHGTRKKNEQDESHRHARNTGKRKPEYGSFRSPLRHFALALDRSHIEAHHRQQVLAHFAHHRTVVRRRLQTVEIPGQPVGNLLFVHLGDILPLTGEIFGKDRPSRGIAFPIVQRGEHPLGIIQRIIIGRQDIAGVGRQVAHISHSLNAQQHDHRKEDTDADGQFLFGVHLVLSTIK